MPLDRIDDLLADDREEFEAVAAPARRDEEVRAAWVVGY